MLFLGEKVCSVGQSSNPENDELDFVLTNCFTTVLCTKRRSHWDGQRSARMGWNDLSVKSKPDGRLTIDFEASGNTRRVLVSMIVMGTYNIG